MELNCNHGYEIQGLRSAKSKKAKIKAIDDHIHWLEWKNIEVKHELERRVKELKESK